MRRAQISDTSKLIADLSPEQLELLLLRLNKLDRARGDASRQITPQSRESNIFPLSSAQQRLWFLDQLVPNNPVYNMSYALRLTGSLNMVALRKSINEVIRHHKVLRTTFTVIHGQPVQVIAPTMRVALPVVNVCDLPESERETEVIRLAVEEAQRPFDLSKGPLLWNTLFRLAENDHVLLLTIHHIVCDGWSMRVLIREMAALYEAFSTGRPSPLPELPIQYADFAVWQRQWLQDKVLEDLLAYWRRQLSGELPMLELPTDRPRPAVETFRGATHSVTLSKTLADAFKALSRREGVTLFMTLLAAFKMLLHRYTGQDDILVGTPVANRARVELERLIGFFTNTLVMRTDLSGNPSFRNLLARVREVTSGALAHQDLPFERVVEELRPERELNRNPLFQVMFALQTPPVSVMEVSGLTLSPLWIHNGTAKFDLSLDIVDTKQELVTLFEYNTDLFDDTTIGRMAGHFQTLLEGIVANPEQRLSDLPLLTEEERRMLLVEWNDTQVDYPKDLCIHELFEAQVERTPNAVAVVFEDEELTYEELNQRANQLAHYLRKVGVGPEVLVGICVERSLEMVIGILGILKAGGAYVPLDPAYPKERLAFMLQDIRAPVLLTKEHLIRELPEHGAKVVCLDSDWGIIIRESANPPLNVAQPENLAYVTYTSGSTGKPKGVMVAHGSLVNAYLAWEDAYSLRSISTCHLQMASFSFDVFVGDLVRALCSGAKLVLCPQDFLLAPEKLYELMYREKVDCTEFTPAVLRNLIQYIESTKQSLDFMRLLIVGSDTWYISEYKNLLDHCAPETRLINSYGVAEATIDSTYFESSSCSSVDDSYTSQAVPIGRPIANTQVYILDRHLQPVPVGVPGELCVGGENLARGYLHRPDLTAEQFIPNPFSDEPGARLYKTEDLARYRPDGTIEFLGRIDYQVKIRGIRIEPGEIEAVLQEHPSVQESVVIAREDVPGNKYLAAYVIHYAAQASAVSELRRFLKERLPEYMIPSAFVMLEALPLTPNKKVDRRALPAPSRTSPEDTYVAPRNELERTIADIWQELLRLERVGIHDNFFELGGHSLLASRLVLRMREAFQIEFPLRELFESPTVADLAQVIDTIRRQSFSVSTDAKTIIDLEGEVALDPTISPESKFSEHVLDPACIFLTGATGFVGAHLLRDLLDQTEAEIFCLVRASNAEDGKKRITRSLESYQLWNESLSSRIVPVVGDLAQPYLGLSAQQFRTIASRTDIIYHCGYWVNFIYPYHVLKATNVLGTQEVLRLASQIRVQPMHFISTLSVFSGYPTGSYIQEDCDPEHSTGLLGGYNQSKWVAEKLIMLARSRGIPACIYRPGLIGGHSHTGIGNTKDLIWNMIKGCIQLGSAPNIHMIVDLVPVDYVSRAIIHLSRQNELLGKGFHLFNPHPLSWNDLVDRIRSYGYPLQQVSYDEWRVELFKVAAHSLENALVPFVPLFYEQAQIFQEKKLRFDCQNTLSGLADTSIICLTVDQLLDIYFAYFIHSGFLDTPLQVVGLQSQSYCPSGSTL